MKILKITLLSFFSLADKRVESFLLSDSPALLDFYQVFQRNIA